MARPIFQRIVPARTPAHERELLPEGRLSGPMPWVIAIMLFLTTLSAAAGLALIDAAAGVGDDMAGRVTIQVADPNPTSRADQVRRIREALSDQPYVRRVAPVDEVELKRMMREWLGDAGMTADLPIPALIDVDLVAAGDTQAVAQLRAAVAAVAPDAGVEPHADWLGAVARLVRSLAAVAVALMLMMGIATIATVTLATRGALNTHYATIEILHLIGSTDRQIARLFQRRIAMDATFGCTVGFLAAFIVIMSVGWQFRDVAAGLLSGGGAPRGFVWDYVALLALPIAGVAIATWTARMTITRALHRIL
ncbi:MAG: cell division protein [Sphingomonadales bacterium]|nr:cell division protein [Sphingomonadales bacterium]